MSGKMAKTKTKESELKRQKSFRETKEKEEKHEGVAGSDCYCRPYSGGGVWLQD